MDNTTPDELLSTLSEVDPAEAPDIADELADQLAVALEEQPVALEEQKGPQQEGTAGNPS